MSRAEPADHGPRASTLVLLPQYWGRRATLFAPGDRIRGLRSSRTTVLTNDERGRGTKRSGGGPTCNRRTQLVVSSAIYGLLETTATARLTLLASKIDGPPTHWEGVSEDPLRRRCRAEAKGATTRQLSARPPAAVMVLTDVSLGTPHLSELGERRSVIVHDPLLACRGEDGDPRARYQGLSCVIGALWASFWVLAPEKGPHHSAETLCRVIRNINVTKI